MAVAFDASVGWTNVNGVASLTISGLTVSAGSNRVLVVPLVCGSQNVNFPSGLSVVWDSGGTNQSMSQISGTFIASGANTWVGALYGLAAPTSGNKSLVVSWTGNNEMHACAASYTGADQTGGSTTFKNGTTATGSSTTASVTVTSPSGDIAIACHIQNVGLFSASGFTGTSVGFDNSGPNTGVAANFIAGSGSAVLSWPFSPTGPWNSIGCDILAASGGVAVIPTPTRLLMGVGI